MLLGAVSCCVAGAALGASPVRFAWHAKHSEHLRLVLCSRRSTWSTFIEVGGSLATSDAFVRLRFVLRGRRSTWSTFIEVSGSPATSDVNGRRLVLHFEHFRLVSRGRRSTWSTSGSFCVAGEALGAPPVRVMWHAKHSEHLRFVVCGRRSTWSTFIEVGGSLATSDAFGRRLVLHGRRSTWSTSDSSCEAGAALGAPS